MSRSTAPGVRGVVNRTVMALALIGIAAAGAAVSANPAPGLTGMPVMPAPLDNPDPGGPTDSADPKCMGVASAVCQGGPFALPMGPLDPKCLGMPGYAACVGGPYAIQSAPPPVIAPPPAAAAPPPVIAPPPMAAPPVMHPPPAPSAPIGGDMAGMPGSI
jgi:hypothetical protein